MKNTTYQKNDVWKWLRITAKYHNNIVDIVQFQGSDDNVYHYFPKTWELKLLADATQTEVIVDCKMALSFTYKTEKW